MTKIYIDLTEDGENLEVKGIFTCCSFMRNSLFETKAIKILPGVSYQGIINPRLTIKVDPNLEYLNERTKHKGLAINYCPACGSKITVWDAESQRALIPQKNIKSKLGDWYLSGITIEDILIARKQ